MLFNKTPREIEKRACRRQAKKVYNLRRRTLFKKIWKDGQFYNIEEGRWFGSVNWLSLMNDMRDKKWEQLKAERIKRYAELDEMNRKYNIFS